MNPRFTRLIAVCFALWISWAGLGYGAEQKPNIVLFYIDDWAWNGSPVPMDEAMANSRMPVLQMPNVEKLAREGMKFRNAYASPQCSPARVCVQTGQSTPRNGFSVYMNDRGQEYYNEKQNPGFPVIDCVSDMTIDPNATTIPEALKPLGYVSAHIGKWHMRGDPGDEGYVLQDGDTNNNPGNTLRASLQPGEKKPKRLPKDLTDPKLMFSLTDRAIGFIEQQAKAGQPFYLQISHYAMHAGQECLPATREKYAKHPLVQAYYEKNDQRAETISLGADPAVWFGMGEDLDGRIGAVLNRIEELGLEENTYVILVADNGYRHNELLLEPGLTQPHHAAKWWVWQGGIRVPMIVKGPGIQPGSVFEGNVVNYDFLPTFVDWAGGDPQQLQDIDGVSLAGYLAGKQPEAKFLNRPLYFHYPHYRSSMPHSAIVKGSRKVMHFYERPDMPMLFDLAKDPGEVNNLAQEYPEQHKQLFEAMMGYFEKVGARIPKPNPDYNPEDYQKDKAYEKRVKWGPFTGRRELESDEIPTTSAKVSQHLPNIIFILADDLGYADLGCYGHPYARTPTLDKLAAEGTRFTQFYVSGVTCCPSRTGFMTGLFPARFQKYPAPYGFGDRTTVTDLLKQRGYRTGHFGKWHIGPETDNVYGIDEYRGGSSKHDPRGRDAELFDKAIEFIKANADQPMYVNVWGHATHYPVNPHPALVKKFKHVVVDRKDFSKTMQEKFDECLSINGDLNVGMQKYLADVYSIDQNVKRLLDTLDELGLRENTIVVFTSDHGPAPVLLKGGKKTQKFSSNMLGYAGEFRGGKHQQYEGGLRVPFIIRWPAQIKANHVDKTSVISAVDWLPTLCRIAGVRELPGQLDGEDVSDLWLGANRERTKPLFWKTNSANSSPAIRDGKWKFHFNRKGGPELYDLSQDPSESRNLVNEAPAVVTELTRKLNAWVAELPASYDHAEAPQPKRKSTKQRSRRGSSSP